MGLLNNVTQQQYYNGNDYGSYQFTSLENIITQFQIAYVGEGKIIQKIKRADIAFHAQRALQEFSFDTFKSIKAQEILVPNSLQMILPQDYVGYVKISTVDEAGIKHRLYPTLGKTSNPSSNPLQDDDGDFKLQATGTLVESSASVVLDDEYKDIVVGMFVIGPYIPNFTKVAATSNSGGITTITMEDVSGNSVFPLIPGTATGIGNAGTVLTFENNDGSLISPQKSSHIVENLSWNITDYKITASAAADIANIEVGMILSHDNFPVGTKVINVDTVTIVVDKLPDTEVTSGGEVTFISLNADTDTWTKYKSATPSENTQHDYDYDDDIYDVNHGRRYGLEPSHAQINGSFYIDDLAGKIHFSSNISGRTVILDYISDSLGTDGEMQVHKFAEEAMYKYIAYAILSTSSQAIHQQLAPRFKKEKFAATRQAKLRLSNIKLEELTQVLRGKSKHIKH